MMTGWLLPLSGSPMARSRAFLLTKVNVGDVIIAVKPAGVFTLIIYQVEKDIVFFAAGSGITPVFSQTKVYAYPSWEKQASSYI
jgi:ferredoxin-NADP reductase